MAITYQIRIQTQLSAEVFVLCQPIDWDISVFLRVTNTIISCEGKQSQRYKLVSRQIMPMTVIINVCKSSADDKTRSKHSRIFPEK